MLPVVPEQPETTAAYEVTLASLEQAISNTHLEWFETISTGIGRELDRSLLVQ